MTPDDAEFLTLQVWACRRAEMIEWLCRRGFSSRGAMQCIDSFIETMRFVARETGEPQIGDKS